MTNLGSLVWAIKSNILCELCSLPRSVSPLHPMSSTPPQVAQKFTQGVKTAASTVRVISKLNWSLVPSPDHTAIPTSPCPRQGSRIFTLNCTRQRINSHSQGPTNQFKVSKEAVLWDERAAAERIWLEDERESNLFDENSVCLLRSLSTGPALILQTALGGR
jgi:hypothetical protein